MGCLTRGRLTARVYLSSLDQGHNRIVNHIAAFINTVAVKYTARQSAGLLLPCDLADPLSYPVSLAGKNTMDGFLFI